MRVRGFRGRCLARALVGAACALIACNQEREAPEQASVSRVVLVTIDTLRADHVGAYGAGRARTPVLDRLARRGVRFEAAIAPSPMTQPSHATLFTALDPPRHGLRSNGTAPLPEDVTTLAERMRDAGFATAGFIGAVILESHYGFAQGFEQFGDRMESARAGELVGLDARRADAVVDAALEWLEQAPSRFFLWVHVYDPHAPYDAPRSLRGLLATSHYAAEVAFADAQVGRLLEAVDARWPDGGTLVAVTSDHGESLGEHGEDTHAYSIYDATQRVPLILAGGGVPEGRVVETQVRLADVAPTLLARAGVEPLPAGDGVDLAPLWSGDAAEPRPALVETIATHLHFGWSPVFGVRSEGYKYIRAPRPELYDLTADPAETRNLASREVERVAALDGLVTELLAGGRSLDASGLDPERQAQLERLGYLVPASPERTETLHIGGPDPKDHLHELASFRQATAHLRHGRPVQAQKALEGLPASTFVSTLRADAALAAGRPRVAERYARQALVGGPDDAAVQVTLGNALLRQGRLEDAHAAFARAAELHPASPEAWIGLGLVAERREQPQRAAAMYRRATETRLASPEARWLLAGLLLEEGRVAEAQALLDTLPDAMLEQPLVAARLATAEARGGRADAALERLEAAARRSPNDPMLERARARIERQARTR
jgi:arylsulfatase A-like enzyme/Tfp pilus assembly protein PilF